MSDDSLNIELRSACDTYMDIREVKPNKFFHKLEDLFSWRWNGRRYRTLVERIHNDVSRSLHLEGEHFFEAIYHSAIARIKYSTIVSRIESGEDIATEIGASRKLDEERRKQVVKSLFIDIPEVKTKVGHRCLPGVPRGYDISYDRGTAIRLFMSVSQRRIDSKKDEPHDAFPRTRYRERK